MCPEGTHISKNATATENVCKAGKYRDARCLEIRFMLQQSGPVTPVFMPPIALFSRETMHEHLDGIIATIFVADSLL